MQEHKRSLIVSGGLLSAIFKGQFYVFLFVGLIGPAGAFEQKLTVSLFVEHENRNFLNVR